MADLLILGSRAQLLELVPILHGLDSGVTLVCEPTQYVRTASARNFDLFLTEVCDDVDLEPLAFQRKRNVPWLVFPARQTPDLARKAYELGALAVLPPDASTELILKTIRQVLHLSGVDPSRFENPAKSKAVPGIERRFRAGDFISVPEGALIEVVDGIIAQTIIHPDGTEALVGLHGQGQVLVRHPEETCLHLHAHSRAKIRIQTWPQSALNAETAARLRQRVVQTEAWIAMQARTNMEQRLLGILSLLAEQFGRDLPEGRLIDLRLTHVQLASAIGATRTTITRLLSQLRRRRVVTTMTTQGGERFCLSNALAQSSGWYSNAAARIAC